MKLEFYLNNVKVVWDVEPDEYLSHALRRHGILSIRIGCEKPFLSCGVLAMKVEGKHVTTVEGIQEEANRLADFFADEGADQCSFCGVGFALIVHALKHEYKNPTDEQIRDFIVGNMCRCTGYQSQFKAIKAYLAAEGK